MISHKTDFMGKCCCVCFNSYNGCERRPRSLPCGHTFCSQCISNNLQQDRVTCPSCRSAYQATSSNDFPVNFALESIVQDLKCIQSNASGIATLPVDASRGISKKLRSMRLEVCSGVEGLSAKSMAISFDLHHYHSQLEEWKEEHQAIAHGHNRMVKRIGKESERVKEAITEENEERQKLEMARNILSSASIAHEILPAVEDVNICSEELDNWTQRAKKHFPNVELLIQSKELRELSKTRMGKLPGCGDEDEDGEDGEEGVVAASCTAVSDCQDVFSTSIEGEVEDEEEEKTCYDNHPEGDEGAASAPSVQEKVHRALERMPFLQMDQAVQTHAAVTVKVQDLETMTPFTRRMLNSRVFAVQEDEVNGEKRFARITQDENQRLCLHVLGNPESPPDDSFLLQHDDVMNLVDVSYRRIFLVLGVGGRSLGRILIRLFDDVDLHNKDKYAQNFSLLCSGEQGSSYANSNILKVRNKGHNTYERVSMGDYEANDGSGGKVLISGVDWEMEFGREIYKRPWVKGAVQGYYCTEATASKFDIVTKDNPGCHLAGCFGMVEEGLSVLTEAISQHPSVAEIKIMDSGYLLSR